MSAPEEKEWGVVLDVEPTPHKARLLPDGRLQAESQLVVSKEAMERMWQGYMCARCLEDLTPLGAYPKACPLCGFGVREFQREQLERDFVGQVVMEGGVPMAREEAFMEEAHFKPKPTLLVPRNVKE